MSGLIVLAQDIGNGANGRLSDDVTSFLRYALVIQTALLSVLIIKMYRLSHDANPIPWFTTSIVYVLYSIHWLFVVVTGRTVIDEWHRSISAILALSVTGCTVWVLARSVRLNRISIRITGERLKIDSEG